jgi:beta-galactosidase GanA
VTYDNRSLLLNGARSLFHSFGVHYTRATEQQWDDILGKAASDGYNMVQTYGTVHVRGGVDID